MIPIQQAMPMLQLGGNETEYSMDYREGDSDHFVTDNFMMLNYDNVSPNTEEVYCSNGSSVFAARMEFGLNTSTMCWNTTGNNTYSLDNFTTISPNITSSIPEYAVTTVDIILAIILSSLIICVIIGNSLVIASVFLFREMRILTNALIVSLASADLFVAIMVLPLSLTFEITDRIWVLGGLICDFWITMDVFCCTASILNIVVIAMDRYWLITMNVRYTHNNRFPRKRVCMVMVFLAWLLAAIISSAPLFGWREGNEKDDPYQCMISQDYSYTIFSTFGAFWLPLVVILIAYFHIFRIARTRARKRAKSRPSCSIAQSTCISENSSIARKHLPFSRTDSLSPPSTPLLFPQSNDKHNDVMFVNQSNGGINSDVIQQQNSHLNGYPSTRMGNSLNYAPPKSSVYCTALHNIGFNSSEAIPAHNAITLLSHNHKDILTNPTLNITEATSAKTLMETKSETLSDNQVQSQLSDNKEERDWGPRGSTEKALHIGIYESDNCVTRIDLLAPESPDTSEITAGKDRSQGQSLIENVIRKDDLQNQNILLNCAGKEGHFSETDLYLHEATFIKDNQTADENTAKANKDIYSHMNGHSTPKYYPKIPIYTPNGDMNCESYHQITQSMKSHQADKSQHQNGTKTNPTQNNKPESIRTNRARSESRFSVTFKQPEKPASRPVKDYFLRKRDRHFQKLALNRNSQRRLRNRLRSSARTLGLIIGGFILCWMPFFILATIMPFCLTCGAKIPPVAFSVCLWLGYSNSLLNPAIYAIWDKNFRKSFKKILKCSINWSRVCSH